MGIDKKQHQQSLEQINASLTLKDHDTLSDILAKTRLNLHNELNEDFLLVDRQDTIDSLDLITKKLWGKTDAGSILNQTEDTITKIQSILTPTGGTSGWKKWGNNSRLEDQLVALSSVQTRITADVGSRKTEYKEMSDNSKIFETKLKDKSINLSTIEIGTPTTPPTTPLTTTKDIKDDFIDSTLLWTKPLNMDLCDKEWNKLSKDSNGNMVISLKDSNGDEHEVIFEISWGSKFFDGTTFSFADLKIIDTKTKKEIDYDAFDFSKEIELGLLAKIQGTKFDVANFKTIKFKLDPKNVSKKMDITKQITYFDSPVIAGWKIKDLLKNTYNSSYQNTEKELIRPMLDGFFEENEKDAVVKKLLKISVNGNPVSPVITDLNQLEGGFKLYFFSKVQKPTNEELSSISKYNDYLKKQLPVALNEYIKEEIKRQLYSTQNGIEKENLEGTDLDKPETREIYPAISSEIFTIKQELAERKKDGDTEKNKLESDMNNISSPISTEKKLFWLLGTSTNISYMRFLTNQKVDIPEQQIPVEIDSSNTPISSKTYSGNFSIDWKGSNIFSISIDQGDSFDIKATDHISLIKHILTDPRIPYDKMKVHVAYSILKSILEIAKKSWIQPQYMNGTEFTRLKLDKSNTIVLETIDDNTGKRVSKKLFSEQDVLLDNNMDKLQSGIIDSLKIFDEALGKNYNQYKESIDNKLLRHNFPTSWFQSPIKKVMNLSKNTKLDFSFDSIKIPGISKDISISFKKNKFEIIVDGIEKPLSNKDLGKLLNMKNNWELIFQWSERYIIATVYKELIKKLHANKKIAKNNFFVKDPVTQRIYFIDKQWDIGYLPLYSTTLQTDWNDKSFGTIEDSKLSGGTLLTSEEDKLLFYQNPFLMWKLMKSMNKKLRSF